MNAIDKVTNLLKSQYTPPNLLIHEAKVLKSSIKFLAQSNDNYGIFKIMLESKNVIGCFEYKSLAEAKNNF